LLAACASRHEQLNDPASSDADSSASTQSVAPSTVAPTTSQVASVPSSSAPHASGAAPGGPSSGARLLPVSGFESAVIVLPAGSAPVPLLVATHGAGGNPEWECERWGRVARGRWLVLCPRGRALRHGANDGYYYPNHPTLEREVTAATGAARATYGARLAASGGVYLGYSQGATMGALMLSEHGAEFPHLVLLEGGSGGWTLERALRFRRTGGQSVFIACGTEPCARRAAASRAVLERAGLAARTEYATGAGHTELGAVGERAEEWLETLAKTPPAPAR
jgi:predicted esterase